MSQARDRAEFQAALRSDAPIGSVSRFAGFPTGLQMLADCSVHSWDFGNRRDAQDWVDNDLAAVAGNDGLVWEQDVIGGGTSTLVVDVNGFPPHLLLTTPASDGQGLQLQASVGTREIIDFAAVQEVLMYAVMRLSDANNNAATLTQSQLAFGFGPIDTSVLTTIDDFVGFYKADGSSNLVAVCDDDTVALTASTQRRTIKDLALGNQSGGSMANLWFGLGMICGRVNQTDNTGYVHTFFDVGRQSSPQRFDPVHAGTLSMVEVPDQPLAPTIAFAAGEATAKRLSIAKLLIAVKYRLGVANN